MFSRDSFNVTEAKEKLASLKGKFQFPEDGNIAKVNDELEKVLFSMQIYSKAPKYVLTRALYPVEDGSDVLHSARFVIRPSVQDALEVDEMKKTFHINANAEFFNNFIEEMAEWFDTYQFYKQLQVNVDVLNAVVAEVIQEHEIPFDVKFSYGSGLLDASDKHVVVGLSADVIANLSTLPLFDENMESRRAGYKSRIAELLKECARPIDIVKIKNIVTKDLDIYSRRSLSKLIREFVNRKIEYVRLGTGYVETDSFFAVIDKIAVTEEELEEMDLTGAVVIDNAQATSKEKEAGKTKIVVQYRISPFLKEEETPVDVDLKTLVG